MKSDIEIAQEAKMKPIADIAAGLGLADEDVIPYGRYKAKVNHRLIHKASKQGKLILVTAISPTPAGEGKTTTSVGLADAMNAIGKKTMLCLREPSLGPVFGMKGGAAGGGYAQVVPMEDINLHFTGDIHAIGTANNLLAAMIYNSIQQGNPLNIDPRRITWKRCMDMNDRQLRLIVDRLGGKALAEKVLDIMEDRPIQYTYPLEMPLKEDVYKRQGEEDEAVVGTVGAEHAGHIARQLFPAAVGHLGRVGLGVEPAALFGDADGQQLVPLAVELIHEGAGGHAADLVLAGHSAEQDDHTHFMFRIGQHNRSLLISGPLRAADSPKFCLYP